MKTAVICCFAHFTLHCAVGYKKLEDILLLKASRHLLRQLLFLPVHPYVTWVCMCLMVYRSVHMCVDRFVCMCVSYTLYKCVCISACACIDVCVCLCVKILKCVCVFVCAQCACVYSSGTKV